MDEGEREDVVGSGPEEKVARRLSEFAWLMREQERAEADLDPRFAAELRARVVLGISGRPAKRGSWRASAARLGLTAGLGLVGMALDGLRRRR